jgi:hypothetical protein
VRNEAAIGGAVTTMPDRVWGVSFEGQRYGVAFDCPGCTMTHVVNVAAHPSLPNHHVWGWNQSMERPTFTPSLLVRTGHHVTGQKAEECNVEREGIACAVCHSFVRDGRIEFLTDCTHALAGKTVDLPIVPEAKAWD